MNKKGNTLVEVIVSIIIVSIVVTALLSVYTSSRKISRNNSLKENIASEITNVYNIFTSDPSSFKTNLELSYHMDEANKIYFNNIFKLSENKTANYLLLEYKNEGSFYTLVISAYINDIVHPSYDKLARTIVDKVI